MSDPDPINDSGERKTVRREARGKSGFVQTNGVRLHYLEYGQGETTVVVAPGITSPAITWEFVAEELALDARVLVLDIRGRGMSDVPSTGYALVDYAADLAGFIAAVGGARPVVLGHSMGARIAVAMGALHPGVAGSFILADPPLTGPGRADYPTPLEAFRTQLHQAYAGTTAQEVLASYPRWPEREAQIRAEWLATCDENAIVETWNHFHDEDFFELWRAVASPILFIYGQESPVITPEGLAEVVADNPAVQVVGIPGAGHMIPWENLPDFLAAVRSFVGVAKRP